MSKYQLDVFAHGNNSEFPENTYYAEDVEAVAAVVSNCTRTIAGIKKVIIYIKNLDDRDPIDTDDFNVY